MGRGRRPDHRCVYDGGCLLLCGSVSGRGLNAGFDGSSGLTFWRLFDPFVRNLVLAEEDEPARFDWDDGVRCRGRARAQYLAIPEGADGGSSVDVLSIGRVGRSMVLAEAPVNHRRENESSSCRHPSMK